MRSKEFLAGYRAASHDAQKILQEESMRMRDSSAKKALDVARHSVGLALKRKWQSMSNQGAPKP